MAQDGAGDGRHLGLLGATSVGVGAIVGGGILALAGVAFATSGPSAIVAFALNGAIAALAAVSFARLGAAFPESGGTYLYAKKVLTVEVAFMVGWVVWFASIVAAVLYALGFASFVAQVAERGWALAGAPAPGWLRDRLTQVLLALAATAYYAVGLVRRSAGGGQWATAGKVALFAVLILAGVWALGRSAGESPLAHLSPFFEGGAPGLLQAMGYTFIALQGFDLIAAVGGEVRDPERTIPRSIYLSLGVALAIYLPLLFLISTAGVEPGGSIAEAAAANPEGVVALAAERFMGPTGFWLVMVAGVLAMLSALQANLYGASRIAFAMARDRTLPATLGHVRSESGTPAMAVIATAAAVAAVVLLIPDLATAGAASSLIFLISFAMVHWASILARRRSGVRETPVLPMVGAACCLGLALFQGLTVGSAGALVAVWLAAGMVLYFTLFAPGARVADALAEGHDPDLVRLRGRSPLVLVPIANPDSAASLVTVAGTLAAPVVGRILLLSVVRPQSAPVGGQRSDALRDAQHILGEALHASFSGALAPETLVTIAPEPWPEIARVARSHGCESLLLGLSGLEGEAVGSQVEELMGAVDADVVVLRAPRRFELAEVRRVLVPLGGRRDQSHLRARLLGSLCRSGERTVTFLRVVATDATEDEVARAEREARLLAREEAPGAHEVLVVRSDDTQGELIRQAAAHHLVVLGLQRQDRRTKTFGELALRLARGTETPLILISRRG